MFGLNSPVNLTEPAAFKEDGFMFVYGLRGNFEHLAYILKPHWEWTAGLLYDIIQSSSFQQKLKFMQERKREAGERKREHKRDRESANLWVRVASTILWQKEVEIMDWPEDTCQAWGIFT